MIVVDASVVVDLLLRPPGSAHLPNRLLTGGRGLHAPHLLDVEVAQVLRRHEARGKLDATRARAALGILRQMPIVRHGHTQLVARAWSLRRNLTAYDAVYVALTELLDGIFVTRDRRLAAASGHQARVEVV